MAKTASERVAPMTLRIASASRRPPIPSPRTLSSRASRPMSAVGIRHCTGPMRHEQAVSSFSVAAFAIRVNLWSSMPGLRDFRGLDVRMPTSAAFWAWVVLGRGDECDRCAMLRWSINKHLPTLAFPGLSVYVLSRRTLMTDRRTMLRWLPPKIVRSFRMQLGPARGAET